MKVKDLIGTLQMLIEHGLSEDAEVVAFNADAEEVVPVTGFLHDANQIEICTDDMEG
jgi:hypothetical protein